MSTYSIPNMTDGVDNLLVDIATQLPSFIWALLLFVYGVVFLGGMGAQQNKVGYSDMPMWSLLSSLSILILCFIFSLKEGLINLEVLVIVFAITLLNSFWFYLSRGRNEK